MRVEDLSSKDWGKNVQGDDMVLATESTVQIANMLLGLFQQWSQSLGDVSEAEPVRLGEALPVSFELALFQAQVGLQGLFAVFPFRDIGDRSRGGAPQEGDLFGKNLGMLELLAQVDL